MKNYRCFVGDEYTKVLTENFRIFICGWGDIGTIGNNIEKSSPDICG